MAPVFWLAGSVQIQQGFDGFYVFDAGIGGGAPPTASSLDDGSLGAGIGMEL